MRPTYHLQSPGPQHAPSTPPARPQRHATERGMQQMAARQQRWATLRRIVGKKCAGERL